ncbi:hypothetical protein D8B26_001418 [Coccidioides posadasii str. Silveira]|uniref:uncharacterized protein n=1 Tax=Coccidioides posadasii (strain RMSCC 757 / Silveira) TaxID=443226 RepID=UPI001BEE7B40|nr:hypothetical protein D8B26_001418 [Coccidioides posadasii str. Silveira]
MTIPVGENARCLNGLELQRMETTVVIPERHQKKKKKKKKKSRLILSPSINDKESKGTPASAWPVKGSIAYHHSLFQKGTPQKRKNQGETLLSFNPTAKAAWRIRVVKHC